MNLINCKNLHDLFVNHVIDSLSILEFLPNTRLNVCDIGPGAGFPGIILSIFKPSFHYVLLEPSKKYFLFLKKIIEELKMEQIKLIPKKVEEFSISSNDCFNILLSRAVGRINDLFFYSSKIMDKNCLLFLFKSACIFHEMNASIDPLADADIHVLKKIKILETHSKNHYIIGIQKGERFT